MDLTRFGLRRRPFAPAPDPRAFVPLTPHEAAVESLRQAFAEGDGPALLDGEPGSGKTSVALRFLHTLPDGTAQVFLPASRFTRPADLFQALLFDFGSEYRGLNETELRLAVSDRLLHGVGQGKPTAVVLDEAQHLSDEVLEEVRLMGNLAGPGTPAAVVVLVAQPSLRARLGAAGLGTVAQRVRVRPTLRPLDRDESVRFLREQLPGAEHRLDAEAAGLLAEHARGVPRLLNQAAAEAFRLAAEGGADAVDVEAAVEALTRLGLYEEAGPAVLPHPAQAAARRPRKRKSA